jgi:chromosome partitioning protein
LVKKGDAILIFVIGAEKGGVGKSTLAETFAYRIVADATLSAILFDTDTTATVAGWSAIRQAAGLVERVSVVANTRNPTSAIVDLATKYDAVIVDVGARDYERMRELAVIADLWVLPTRVGQPDLESTVELCETLKAADGRHKNGKIPLVIVLNQVPNSPSEEADAREALAAVLPNIPVGATAIRERKVWRDAGRAGKTIFEMPRRDAEKAVAEFEAFFLESLTFQSITKSA